MSQKKTPHTLGHENIGKLLLEYSLPAIVAMTASSLYNIIDRIFIGQGVGALAISGLALTLPFMNLGVAIGALIGAGAATLVSIRLGEKRGEEASYILGNTVVLNLILSSSYTVIALFFLEDILYLFGASEATLPFAKQFMQIILLGNLFLHLYMGLNNIMRSSGYPQKAMFTTLATVGINLILAPLFIFVFKWGIRGAAFATVISQFAGFLITIIHFINKNSFLHFMKGHFRLRGDIIQGIFAIGMSPFVINVCACLIIIIINLQLVKHGGDFAVGAYGIINSVLMFVLMVILGLTQGMQPIAGYNFGALQYERVRTVFRYTVIAATCISVTGFLAGELLPRQISLAFTGNNELVGLSVTGMRIVMIFFPLVGFQMVTSNFFQSIGRAKISVILTLTRQVIFLIPALIILPPIFGLAGVWASVPVADFFSIIVTAYVLKTQGKKVLGI
ncbi:MAG TPA: MATE family efflux transporter [Spirochaetota bacterium]|nr:MATE family efflux transporter [Spirochaetota bacterium]HRX46377.1 MATE family efflux transporter [Spirochaetota bacterium]